MYGIHDALGDSSFTARSAEQINSAMGRVYGYMMMATLVSMFTSYSVGTNPQLMALLFGTALKWVVLFAPLVFIFVVPILFNSGIGLTGAVLTLNAFAAMMGLSLATIFVVFSMGSIFTAFMGAAVLFGVMSFYGYFTKRSLDGMGSFLFVGLIALIIASLINIFIGSTVMQMVISSIAILIFLGFTAYDTQKIREQLMDETGHVVELYGALTLYLDFINLFINLLQIIGVAPGSDD
jgi:FtsH-binding integral membrane protein